MIGKLAKAALVICFTFGSQAIASDLDNQERFLGALALLEEGRADEGVDMLRTLYADAPTPRVRLEFARALMVTEKWQEARQLFLEAFKDDPPPVVRANILSFISLIDRRKGKLSLSASVARYENPLQQPGAYTLTFAGIELAYEPESIYRNLWGVNVGADFSKEFSNGWQLTSSAAYRDLQFDAADRFTGDVSFSRRLGLMPLEVKFGATRLGQKGQSFTLPYGQVAYAASVSAHSMFQPAVTVGYNIADIGKSSSGWQAEAFVPFVYSPVPTKLLAVGPTALKRMAGFSEQAYTSLGLRAFGKLNTASVNVELGAQATATKFDAVDPFWGVRRSDKGLFASAMVSSYRIRIGPFVPAVGATCNITDSNVDYYRQRGCDVQFEVRKLF